MEQWCRCSCWDDLYTFALRLGQRPLVDRLLAAFIALTLAFQVRHRALRGVKTLDVRLGYTPEQAADALAALGAGGRKLYAATELTLDVAFPLVYTGLFAGLIARWHEPQRARGLLLVPLVGGISDLKENATAATLALTYNGKSSPLAWVTSIAGVFKFACFIGSTLLVLWGGAQRLRKG